MYRSSHLEEVLQKLKQLLPYLTKNYHVATLEVFGSFARGEEGPDSDLDILVTFTQPPTLFQFVELEQFLSESLGVQIDLVMKTSLKPTLGRRILREAIPI